MLVWIQKLVPALLVCLLAACSGAAGTASDASGLSATLTFDPEPHIGTVECTVALTNADGTPAPCTEVELEGNMNQAGMVPVSAAAEARGEGTFVAELEFTMGGDWLIFVRGKSPEGKAFEIVKDVTGVRRKPQADPASKEGGQ